MKFRVLLLLLCSVVFMNMSAQEYAPFSGLSIGSGYRNSFVKNRVFDNTFLSVGFGGNIYLGDFNGDAAFEDRLGSLGSVSFGKWFNPYIANRLKYDAGVFKNFEYDLEKNLSIRQLTYGNVHLDFMFDITNCLGRYDERRIMRIIPFVGGGYAHRPEKVFGDRKIKRSESPTLNMGLLIPIRLSERVDLYLEGQYTMLNEQFNRVDMHHEEDRLISAMFGLNFKLGKTNFQVIESMDYYLLNDLNNEINNLRSQNDELSKRPKYCPECPENSAIVNNIEREMIYKIVVFKLNSSIIDANQMTNIFDMAKFAIQNNVPIKITGYADRETGNPKYNYTLSEKRARAVAKILNEKYGVSKDKISISWYGDELQPYIVNEWNRLVIMESE